MPKLSFGTRRPCVRAALLGPRNDNPNYIIQVGNVFGLSFLLRISFKNCKATRSVFAGRVALDGGMAAPFGCAVPH